MKHPLDLHRPARRPVRHAPRGFVPRRRTLSGRDLAAMLLAGMAGGLGWVLLPDLAAGDLTAANVPPRSITLADAAPVRASFGFCHSGGGGDCVVDGDTFWIGGVKVRIADIDTPETHPARCAREAELGEAATRRLHALLNTGAVELTPIDRDTDRYGRKLRLVAVDGAGVGDTLVAEGLARRYAGGRRKSWCD